MRIAPLVRPPLLRSLFGSAVIALGVGACLTMHEPEPMSAVVIDPPVIEIVPQAEGGALALQIAEAQSGCMYYSSFDTGSVEVQPGQQSKVLHRAFSFMDGCEWESEERLELERDGRYRYTYTEHAVSCPPDRVAASPCTRSGYAVTSSTEEPEVKAEAPAQPEPFVDCEG